MTMTTILNTYTDMEYIGKIYGRISGKYFPLDVTTEDVDKAKDVAKELRITKKHLAECKNKYDIMRDRFDQMAESVGNDIRLREVKADGGSLDVKLESEQVVRFFSNHMKALFDSVKGADNYYTVDLKFHGDGKRYNITFQRFPGKTPLDTLRETQDELDALKKKLSKITEEKIKKTIEETEYDMHVSEEVHSSHQRYDILAKAVTNLLKEER